MLMIVRLRKKIQKQAVAELCQAQVQFNLDWDLLGEDLYMFFQNLKQDQNIETKDLEAI